MDRREEDACIVPEDLLRSIAMMEVNIDDRYSAQVACKKSGGDRGVVQICCTGCEIGARMVA